MIPGCQALSRQGEGGSLKDAFREGPRCLSLCWGRGWGTGHARALPPNTHGRKTTPSFSLQVREKFMFSSQQLTWLPCIRKPGFRCECGLAADPVPLATLPCPSVPPGPLTAVWTYQCHLWGYLAPEPTPDPRTWSVRGDWGIAELPSPASGVNLGVMHPGPPPTIPQSMPSVPTPFPASMGMCPPG